MQLNMEELLQLIQGNNNPMQPPKSINLQPELLSAQEQSSLPEQIHALYKHIFNVNQNKIDLQDHLPFTKHKTAMPVCNKVFSTNEPVFRCYDCFKHQAAVFCRDCFERGDHTGHRYVKISSGGGNCDCGNAMAVKEEGFCPLHTGRVCPVSISQQESQRWMFYWREIFSWFLNLWQRNKKNGEEMGRMFIPFLKELNQESIFYNTLTSSLFQHTLSISTLSLTILEHLFRITSKQLSKSICSLFFEMFSLNQFKYLLSKQFIHAYNTVEEFESTGYHSLYIQLLANTDLTTKLFDEGIILHPNRQYNAEVILDDLMFICTLEKEVIVRFFTLYFQYERIICLPFMKNLHQDLNKDNEALINAVTNNLSTENHYYYLVMQLLKTVHDNHDILCAFLKGLYQEISQHRQEYEYNRVVLPYHRAFSLGVFVLWDGCVQDISLEGLQKVLGVTEEELVRFLKEAMEKVLGCLLEFGETFAKPSYFDNYLAMYIYRGTLNIHYDQLFVRIVCHLFNDCHLHLTETLLYLFHHPWEQNRNPQLTLHEHLKKWVYFISLLMEIMVSNRCEVLLSTKLDIKSPHQQQAYENLFIEVCNFMCPLQEEGLKTMEKYFLGKINEEVLMKHLIFDKVTKRYLMKAQYKQQAKLCFPYQQTLKKLAHLFPNQQEEAALTLSLEGVNVAIGKALHPRQIILCLFNKIIEEEGYQMEEKPLGEVCQLFTKELLKLVEIFRGIVSIAVEEELIVELMDYGVRRLERKQTAEEESRRASLQREKKLDKLNKLKQKQNKFLHRNKLQLPEPQPSEQHNPNSCMICHQSTSQPLCYLSYLHKTNTFLQHQQNPSSEQPSKQTYFFTSCLHTAHYRCCFKLFGKKSMFQCPLCKSYNNVLLPISGNTFDKDSFPTICSRISTMAALSQGREMEENLNDEENVFVNVVKAMVEMIGLVAVKNAVHYENNVRFVVESVYFLLRSLWKEYSPETQENLIIAVNNHLKQLHVQQKQISESVGKVLLSVEYLIINVIFSSLHGCQPSFDAAYNHHCDSINYLELKVILQAVYGLFMKEVPAISSDIINDQITSILCCVKYFQPPQTVKDLLKFRQDPKNRCKNGHNLCICVVCEERICLQCSNPMKHIKMKHAGNGLFFNVLTGAFFYQCDYLKFHLKSLYENKIGHRWSMEKEAEGYILDKEEYERTVELISEHGLHRQMERKSPEQGRRNYFDMLEQ